MAANMSNHSAKLVNYQVVYEGQVISVLLTEEDGEKLLDGDSDLLHAVINSRQIEKDDHVNGKPSCSSSKPINTASTSKAEHSNETTQVNGKPSCSSSKPINTASTSKAEHSNETTQESDWTPKNTRYLISLVRQKLYTEEGEKLICKSGIWKEISLKLKQNGHIHSSERCRGKWKTLITSYKKITDSNKQSGENRKTHEFSDELSFLDKSADVEPAYIFESSKDGKNENDSKSDDDEQAPSLPKKSKKTTKGRKSTVDSVIGYLKEFNDSVKEAEEKTRKQRQEQHEQKMELMACLVKAITSKNE